MELYVNPPLYVLKVGSYIQTSVKQIYDDVRELHSYNASIANFEHLCCVAEYVYLKILIWNKTFLSINHTESKLKTSKKKYAQ